MQRTNIRNSLFICIFLPFFNSCSYLFDDRINDYLKEKEAKSIVMPENISSLPVVDFYPLPENAPEDINDDYEVPLPQQVFSSGTTNEVRLHKLGEVRWIYVETLPSSTWPLMKDYWSLSEFGLNIENPTTGIIESNSLVIDGNETKFVMKIEHGIRQASSEIFISHLLKGKTGSWVRVEGEENLEERLFLSTLDFLSNSTSSGGTSLVALNLNIGQKAVLKQNEDLSSYIELNLEFSRAWAAVDRALKEALIKVNDLDRDEGVFYVSFTQEDEKGFVRSLFSGDSPSKGNFKIIITEDGKNKCIVTVGGETEDSKIFERDLLSEINQSLS